MLYADVRSIFMVDGKARWVIDKGSLRSKNQEYLEATMGNGKYPIMFLKANVGVLIGEPGGE